MYMYFDLKLVNDGLPARDYKDIHSHVYQLFKAGHIQSVFVDMQGDRYVFKCACLLEMKIHMYCLHNHTNVGHIQTTTCGYQAVCRVLPVVSQGPRAVGVAVGIGPIGHFCEEFYRIKTLHSPRSCMN
jgi:hypothetical protein